MENESLTHNKILGQWLKELQEFELFKAQLELEKRLMSSHLQRLQSIDLSTDRVEAEYVKVRSKLDALKEMQNLRERLIQERNPRDPA